MDQPSAPTPPLGTPDHAPADNRVPPWATPAVAGLLAVGWYLLYRAAAPSIGFVVMAGPLWMVPVVFLLLACAYYAGGRVLSRLSAARGWLWAVLAAVAPLALELTAVLVRGEWDSWAHDQIGLGLRLLAPIAALLGARSAREATPAR